MFPETVFLHTRPVTAPALPHVGRLAMRMVAVEKVTGVATVSTDPVRVNLAVLCSTDGQGGVGEHTRMIESVVGKRETRGVLFLRAYMWESEKDRENASRKKKSKTERECVL